MRREQFRQPRCRAPLGALPVLLADLLIEVQLSGDSFGADWRVMARDRSSTTPRLFGLVLAVGILCSVTVALFSHGTVRLIAGALAGVLLVGVLTYAREVWSR